MPWEIHHNSFSGLNVDFASMMNPRNGNCLDCRKYFKPNMAMNFVSSVIRKPSVATIMNNDTKNDMTLSISALSFL